MTIIEALEAVNEAATKQLSDMLKSKNREKMTKEQAECYACSCEMTLEAVKEAGKLKQAIEIVEGLTPMIKLILDK